MMKFRSVAESLRSILVAAETDKWQTITGNRQTNSATEIFTLPFVEVWYQAGGFEKGASSYQTSKTHDATYQIIFTVAVKAEIDLSVMENPAALPAQRAAALAAMPALSYQATSKMDELFDNVYQTIMDARNYDMGLDIGEVSDRFIDNFTKNEAEKMGEILLLTGSCQLTCTVTEEVQGETGITAAINDETLQINEEDGNNAGTQTDLS